VDEAAENLAHEAPLDLGATLASERERQGLSRADVAHRLHMSPWQIEAIETGDYERLPKGTFLRGFVRNYAKALGLAPEPLLEMLAGAAPATPAPGIVVPTQNIRFDPLGERLGSPYVKAATLALVAVAIAFAAMYWAMYIRPRPPALVLHGAASKTAAPASSGAPAAQPGPAPSQSAPSASASQPDSAPPSSPGPAASPSSPATLAPSAMQAPAPSPASAPSAAPASPAASNAASPAAPVPGAKQARLRFNGESWVEVRDANGDIVFQKLNPAGSEAKFSARPPLQVVVGNAPEVEMTWDGKPFDLDPYTKVAVARFTLE
jgi:cytoskeleton protein RodZ